MSSSLSSINGYRYERKFAIPGLTMLEAEAFIRLLPGVFSEIYYPRMVNNIYLDSVQSQCYFDNVDGLKERVKVRVRWYNNLLGFVEKPVLEFKIRKGSLGKKISHALNPFLFDQTFKYEIIRDLFNISDIPESVKMQLSGLEPSLVNRYKRKYFQSADRKIRITVDTDLSYYYINLHYNSFLNSMNDQGGMIVELKYNADENGYVNSLLKSLPFRMTRSSKYVMGKDKISLA